MYKLYNNWRIILKNVLISSKYDWLYAKSNIKTCTLYMKQSYIIKVFICIYKTHHIWHVIFKKMIILS